MKKQKNNLLICIMIILLILLFLSIYMIFKNNNQERMSVQLTNEVTSNNKDNIVEYIKEKNTIVETSTDTELTDEEKAEIEEYVYKICNWSHGILPEFKNINEANKKWIYLCLEPRIKTTTYSYSTKEEIEEDLIKLFGKDLIFDVEKDIKENSEAYWPNYNEEDGKYDFPHYGFDISTYYAINNIKKNDDIYTVSLIEYFETDDLYEVYSNNIGDYRIVYNYKTRNDTDSHTGVFHIETSKLDNSNENSNIPDKVISSEVLKRKDEFRNFEIILKSDDNGKIYITESKIVENN